MTKVLQMLEGSFVVPTPPTSSQSGSPTSFFKWGSQGATSSTLNDYISDVAMSDVRLSGPR
jgi:hypothetical protein